MFHSKFGRDNSGFTIVELMVTVAITGALSVVAVPNYMKYTAKSRQSEAKLALSAIYVAEKQFGAEWGTFSTCLDQVGYAKSKNERYYAVGFKGSSAVAPYCNPGANTPCNTVNTVTCSTGSLTGNPTDDYKTAYPATVKVGNAFPKDSDFTATMSGVGTTHFSIGAVGSISSGTAIDKWTIDDNKVIVNVQSGI